MTAITKITLNGQAYWNFGECSEDDAAGYREWIESELKREYPGVAIQVNEADSTYSVVVEIDDESDYDEARDLRDGANIFCQDAWDRCPWNWVK